MCSFDTVLLQPRGVIMELIERVPLNDIALALKYEEQDVRSYFCTNMNKEQKDIFFALLAEIDEATPDDSRKAKEYIMRFLKEIDESVG